MPKFMLSTSSYVYTLIYKGILEDEQERLTKIVKDIASRNVLLGATSHNMIYNGLVLYGAASGKGCSVHPSLKEECGEIYLALREFGEQRQFIKHCISAMIHEDASNQDIRNILPDMVVYYIPELKKYVRTLSYEDSILFHKPGLISQWKKAMEYLEYYIGNKLVYT